MNSLRLAALGLAIAAASVQAGDPTVEVVAAGLDNPRGLGFAANGDLYVAEAGSGGTGACRPSPDGQPFEVCYGETGALTWVDPAGVEAPRRVIQGLPSMAGPGGFAASSGPVDVQFHRSTPFIVMGWGGNPGLRAGLGAKSRLFGTVLVATPEGAYLPVSDIAANEQRHNPAGGAIDSNPYGIAVDGSRRIVADAGADALVESGTQDLLLPRPDRTFAVLPRTTFGTSAVPTTVTKGPDGNFYVGQLTGAPFFRGASTIYRVPPAGGSVTPYVTGLTAVVDFTFDRRGTLYIVEIASGFVPPPAGSGDPGVGNGRLLRKTKTGAVEVVLDGLVFPTGVAVDRSGVVFLSHFGIFPGGGEVLRVTLD